MELAVRTEQQAGRVGRDLLGTFLRRETSLSSAGN